MKIAENVHRDVLPSFRKHGEYKIERDYGFK